MKSGTGAHTFNFTRITGIRLLQKDAVLSFSSPDRLSVDVYWVFCYYSGVADYPKIAENSRK